MLTFRKLAHIVDSDMCILACTRKLRAPRNQHFHNPSYILVYRFVVRYIHSLCRMSKYLELRIFHDHMVYCKRVYRLFQLDPMYILACTYIDSLGNRRSHNLSTHFYTFKQCFFFHLVEVIL